MSQKQKTGLRRNTIDKYYTAGHVVLECINKIKECINIDKEHDLCIEPSAGNGAFIPAIKSITSNTLFYDLEPENEQIIKQDYLKLDINSIDKTKYKKIHIIGNPPFGRQSSLAIKFIKLSATYADTISFILPKSFKKNSMKRHFPLEFHLLHERDIADNAFLINGEIYNVPCVFQIWEKKNTKRLVPIKLEPTTYIFVKKTDNPDISFRRVGVYAGKIDKKCSDKSPQSHYFIKFNNNILADNILSDELFNKLSTIDYKSKNNTTGPRSISKQELIAEFNKIL